MSSVWLTIPSARPDAGTVPLWRERGYKIALWRDLELGAEARVDNNGADGIIVSAPYPGYAKAVNLLVKLALCDPKASWCVLGGDDTEPDPSHSPEEIARQCEEHFAAAFYCADPIHPALEGLSLERIATFGVMQPTGDRWADGSIDRICGSPWLGREFCQRVNQGRGPLWPDYSHMFEDAELQDVASKLGVLWQRRDLTHLHHHFVRTADGGVNWGAPPPDFLREANSPEHWKKFQALYQSRRSAGFPGHEPL